MRLLFIVPSNLHKLTAGSRIRYDRLGAAGEHFDIVVQSMEALSPDDLATCDVCVFSKTYSVEAIALADQLRQKGKIVGIDLFDDVFSQASDARLFRFRLWLKRIAESSQFALCSTQVMQDLLKRHAPNLPVHLVPDPFPEIEPSVLAEALAAKLKAAQAERRIDAVWFGNGSNPFFPVGLYDLTSFGWSLADLAAGNFDVHLTILTDKASQTAASLAKLGKLAVPYRLETWSVEAEREALKHSFVSFIPVNGQSFSRAKSFNRALTAISAANQVLSPGFPLYRDLNPAIYTDAGQLIADLARGTCRIRPDNVQEITTVVAGVSEIGTVANDLFEFLSKQFLANSRRQVNQILKSTPQARRQPSERQGLIYGFDQNSLMYQAARSAGILSVGTPFARDRAYDIRVVQNKQSLDLLLIPNLVPLLAAPLQSRCSAPKKVGKLNMVQIDAIDDDIVRRHPIVASKDRRQILQETRVYRDFLVDIEGLCRRVFPGTTFLIGDMQCAVGKETFQGSQT